METSQVLDKKKLHKTSRNFKPRNKERFKPKEQIFKHPIPGTTQIKPGTIILTQEQLAALLVSLGKKADKNNSVTISIDVSNDVDGHDFNLEKELKNLQSENQDHSQIDGIPETSAAPAVNGSGEHGTISNNKTTNSNTGNSEETKKSPLGVSALQKSSTEIDQNAPSTSFDDKLRLSLENIKQISEVNNVPPISWKHMTVGERKRLQWAKEKAEVLDDYNPWGRPGAGAPRHKQEDEIKEHVPFDSAVNNSQPQKVLQSTTDLDRKSNQVGTVIDTKHEKPNAEDKSKWLEELNKQREEQRLAKLALKKQDKEDAGIWVDNYRADHQKLLLTNEILQQQSISSRVDENNSPKEIGSQPMFDSDLEKNNSAPATFLRGKGSFTDPVTRKEQEEKRKVQMEYQAQVKAQIEERARQKKIDQERKKKEDMEQERKIQMERESMNRQLEVEQRRCREREENHHQQIVLMKSAMDEAKEKAVEEKNMKRIHHLQQRGHDVTRLQAAYDGMESSKQYQMYKRDPALISTYNIDTDLMKYAQDPMMNIRLDRPAYGDDLHSDDQIRASRTYGYLSKFEDVQNTPRKEFGTQTLELKELQDILQSFATETTSENRNNVDTSTNVKKDAKVAPHRKTVQKLEKRPLWNQRKKQTVVKNSEKDPFYSQKKGETEIRKGIREKQLLYLQEQNKKLIPSHAKSSYKNSKESPQGATAIEEKVDKVAPVNHQMVVGKSRMENTSKVASAISTGNSGEKKQTSKLAQNTERTSPTILVTDHRTTIIKDQYLHHNNYLPITHYDSKNSIVADFPPGNELYPLMRTTEILDPAKADEPVVVSRENTATERARSAYYKNHHPAKKGMIISVYHDREKEATGKGYQNSHQNFRAISDRPINRQDVILEQLSSLKQTLKKRQKELEDSMSPNDLA